MGIIATIGVALRLAYEVFKLFVERGEYKRKRRKVALKEVVDGIGKKDRSVITSGFDRLNNI